MESIIDAHYFMLPTQGNIYSLSVINLCSGINKFIVASLKKKIFSFEYCENSDGILKPTVKEISCTYIPSGAEIISVDAFNKSKTCDDIQIGIAIAKFNSEGIPETYLNIYSEQDLDHNYVMNIDSIAQNCLMVELNFIPYHLTHSFILRNSGDSPEMVWLLSGSDSKVHVYQEDTQNHLYTEADLAESFPELTNLPSNVMWLDVQYIHNFSSRVSVVGCECGMVQLYVVNTKSNTVISSHFDDNSNLFWFKSSRVSVVGCECGMVQLYVVNTKSNTVISSHFDDNSNLFWFKSSRVSVVGCECGMVQLYVVNTKSNTVISSHVDVSDGSISQVMLFSLSSEENCRPKGFQTEDEAEEKSCKAGSKNDLHLLVCNTLQASVVYMNIEEKGFSDKHNLEGSEMYDACLCACVGDLNMDGCNEIMLGTYGREILVYQWSGIGWDLSGQRSTANPVHSLRYLDLTGDGVSELVVQTLSGVHILQHDPDIIRNIFLLRLRKLCGKEEREESPDCVVLQSLPEIENCPCEEACEQSLIEECL